MLNLCLLLVVARGNRLQRSVAAGVGRKRKTNECITPLHVQSILAQSFMQLSTPCGCLMRLAFYVCHNFCVRGYVEMYNLMVSDFEIMYDHMGKFVRFHERSSKNHKVDLLHCQPVTCYFPDVVATFEAYFDHLPKWLAEDGSSCPLFLRGIDGELSNPSVRLNAMGVPAEIGMKLTGHTSREGYMRYNTDAGIAECSFGYTWYWWRCFLAGCTDMKMFSCLANLILEIRFLQFAVLPQRIA
ncbi:hypothetical protein O6H91_04G090100 [Diphasiastrum complanatum]|uniref:Uncharacterized protein n=1 Tax=Diphasiastrum complanatum TaxID=34168 RepID=A0ACC2DYX6_DIPCM|nr:hypothetical protein O6H91_04G090100 [Diphasiastrum complanatum]